jgi:cytosine/adenosine deaminase-related metal-dependent hydrolase
MARLSFPTSMSRTEALRSYTLNAAYAAFEESSKGSLRPGKLADIVVLSKDILAVPEEEIRTARVGYTIVGRKVLHEGKCGRPSVEGFRPPWKSAKSGFRSQAASDGIQSKLPYP